MEDKWHRSVLTAEILEFLRVKKDSWYLDCTLGDGGHSLEIIKAGGKVVGLDVDPEALERVRQRFEVESLDPEKFKLIRGNFRKLDQLVDELSLDFAGVLFDLGVSTLQLKDPKRGFSFSGEGELDMRMDPELGVRAVDLINVLSSTELTRLFKEYGEDPNSKRVAGEIIKNRPFKTTLELAGLIERLVNKKVGGIHPATRFFQALRIAVNDELRALSEALPKALEVVRPGGRILVISFHGLEDKIVKQTFKTFETEGAGEVITDKPLVPSPDEVNKNIRSRSSKLRVFQKI